MNYRMDPINVPQEDPFRDDAFGRKDTVLFLSDLISRTGGPFVLALDSPWGTGKSVFVNMLRVHLENENYQCVYFDAWRADYASDPLVALVASVEGALRSALGKKSIPRLDGVKKITGIVAKRGSIAALKTFTLGALDLGDEIESALADFGADTFTDLVEAYKVEAELYDKFRTELENTVSSLPASGKKPTLVFFIDELDRCRPSFAIQLLERVKHLFDLANICFVVSVDKKQLGAVVRSVYGAEINSEEYLRRFFDLEYGLPAGDSSAFTAALLKGFGLNSYFVSDEGYAPAHLLRARAEFIEYFSSIADAFQMTLRARERCITRLKIVLDQTPNDQKLHPQILAFLLVLRAEDAVSYTKVIRGEIDPAGMVELVDSAGAGSKFSRTKMGRVLFGLLVAYFPDREKQKFHQMKVLDKCEDTSQNRDGSWDEVRDVMVSEHGSGNSRIFSKIAKKIELASQVLE